MRLHKIRDISSDLYMDVPEAKTKQAGRNEELIAWHPVGMAWETIEGLEAHLRSLVEARQVVSPLWEVEVLDVEMVERYPAIVHSPRKDDKR